MSGKEDEDTQPLDDDSKTPVISNIRIKILGCAEIRNDPIETNRKIIVFEHSSSIGTKQISAFYQSSATSVGTPYYFKDTFFPFYGEL